MKAMLRSGVLSAGGLLLKYLCMKACSTRLFVHFATEDTEFTEIGLFQSAHQAVLCVACELY